MEEGVELYMRRYGIDPSRDALPHLYRSMGDLSDVEADDLLPGGVFLIAQWLLLDSIFPRVEDPWPESIGIGFPFTVAGAFGVLANVIFSEAPQQQRERAIRLGGVYGFQFGAVIYVLSLIVQVASSR